MPRKAKPKDMPEETPQVTPEVEPEVTTKENPLGREIRPGVFRKDN